MRRDYGSSANKIGLDLRKQGGERAREEYKNRKTIKSIFSSIL